MVDYAAKCPPLAKRSTDPEKERRMEQARTLLQRIIDQCMKDPNIIMPLHTELLTLNTQGLAIDTGVWNPNAKNLQRIPKEWKIAFILTEAKKHRISVVTKELMQKVDEDDSENVSTIFQMMLQVPEMLTLPACAQDEAVAGMALHGRCDEVGTRLKQFASAGGFGANGSLDFKKAGSFTLLFNEAGVCTEIKHISGVKCQPPAHVVITRAYTMQRNSLDFRAEVQLLPNVYKLHELFSADDNFKQIIYTPGKTWRRFEDAAQKTANDFEQKDQEKAAARCDDPSEVSAIVQNVAKKRAEVNLSKAREALKERETKRQRKREVDLAV